MKNREEDRLFLRRAFPPTPAQCSEGLNTALYTIKEEKKGMGRPGKVLLVAAMLLLLAMASAVALARLGLVDFLGGYDQVALPDSAKAVLSDTEAKTYEVGPLLITLRETLYDGHIAYTTFAAAPKESGRGLIHVDEKNSPIPESEAERLQVDKGLTLLQGATQADVPLYLVTVNLTPANGPEEGEEMRDIVWGEDGEALLVNMRQIASSNGPATLRMQVEIHVLQVSPYAHEWRVEDTIKITKNEGETVKTYEPEGDGQLGGYTLHRVEARQTVAGVYLSLVLTAGEQVGESEAHSLYKYIEYRDVEGQQIPEGISLSGEINTDGWPSIVLEHMLGIGELPETMVIYYGADGSQVVMK